MTILFYCVMLLWLVLGGVVPATKGGWRSACGTWLLPFLAVLLVGWRVFGAPIQ